MIHCMVLAGGSGTRIGGTPKQFRSLAGLPLLLHSVRTFLSWEKCQSLTVVSGSAWMEDTRSLLTESPSVLAHLQKIALVQGGSTRHKSQAAGVAAICEAGVEDDDLIFIHDAARPFVTLSELETLAAAFADRAVEIASLASPAVDTIVQGAGLPGVMRSILKRDELFLIKTPQALRVSALPRLLACQETSAMTDLLTWGQAAGIHGTLCPAGHWNIKVTLESDFALAEAMAQTDSFSLK
ncbi:MAG: 2-C-methyl-D-erythritol 4-phosphate cytidylyltransferase [Spirochaetia bacterium]|nr:2-C-methyl-D-erythritol 4-phosphate cytidylyltransferase [Spirochaetia bacterium]